MNTQKFVFSLMLASTMALAAAAQAQLLGGAGSIGGSLSGAMNGGLLNGGAGGNFGGMSTLDSGWVNDRADDAAAGARNTASRAKQVGSNESNRTKAAATDVGSKAKSGVNNLTAYTDQAASGSVNAAANGAAATHGASGTANADSSANSPTGGTSGAAAILGGQSATTSPTLWRDSGAAAGNDTPPRQDDGPARNGGRQISGRGSSESSAHGSSDGADASGASAANVDRHR